MAVLTQYIVEHNAYSQQGKQAMIFTSKKEADAYDKAFDIADSLQDFLQRADCKLNDTELETLSLYIAIQRDEVMQLLKGKKSTDLDKGSDDIKTKADTTHKENEAVSTKTEKNIKAAA